MPNWRKINKDTTREVIANAIIARLTIQRDEAREWAIEMRKQRDEWKENFEAAYKDSEYFERKLEECERKYEQARDAAYSWFDAYRDEVDVERRKRRQRTCEHRYRHRISFNGITRVTCNICGKVL